MVSRSSICSTPHAREFLEKFKISRTPDTEGKEHGECTHQGGGDCCRGPLGHCCKCSRRQHGHDQNTTQGTPGR